MCTSDILAVYGSSSKGAVALHDGSAMMAGDVTSAVHLGLEADNGVRRCTRDEFRLHRPSYL
jgi:hypothetical protein